MAETLTIHQLQSIIFNLEMQVRKYTWNAEHENARQSKKKIVEYTLQLRKLQEKAFAESFPYVEGEDYYTVEDTTGNPHANPIVLSCWDDQSEELHNKDSKYFDTYEDAFRWMLDVADWTYQYSDDPKVWRRGSDWMSLIRRAVNGAPQNLLESLLTEFNNKKPL